MASKRKLKNKDLRNLESEPLFTQPPDTNLGKYLYS